MPVVDSTESINIKHIIGHKKQLLVALVMTSLFAVGLFILGAVVNGAPVPIAAYNFNEGSGTTLNDVSGNGLSGQVSGASWSTAGKNGGALSFDGVNDWVTVADANKLDLTTGMTMEAWVKPTTLPTGWKSVILKERTGDHVYALHVNTGVNRPAGEINRTSGFADVRGKAKVATGAWTHLTTTYDGTTLKMFVNGVQVSSKAASGSIITSTGALRFGGNGVWNDEFFNGLIDDIRIYNVALTQSEIQSDMNTPVANDTVAPTVSVTAPTGGATVSGSAVNLAATATDNVGVAGVQFKIDGTNVGSEDTTSPHSITWNSLSVPNGAHTVTAVARDAAGNQTTSAVVNITVNNPAVLIITQPTEGQNISGTTVNISYNFTGDPTGVNHAHFRLDGGTTVMDLDGDGSYAINNVAPGSHNLVGVIARGDHSEIAGSQYTVNFTTTAPDATPPTVAVTAPQNNTNVSGTVSVTADAGDNVGVAGVQFKLNGVNLGAEDTTAPYSTSWNTTTSVNGPQTLTAVARDTTNNQATSSSVIVAVNNADPRAQVGEWSSLMDWPLVAIHNNLLHNGKVLVWDEDGATTQPRLWDPVTQTFTLTPTVAAPIFCSGQISLEDGRILVVGGDTGGAVGIKNTYIYDPVANTWTRTSDMVYARYYPALSKLSDGRVAIFSGAISGSTFADKIEIYNPATGTTSVLNNIDTVQLYEQEYPLAAHLPNGKILVMSGENGGVQLFDPTASTWSGVNTLPLKFGSAVQYRPGKTLMSGGGASFGAASQTGANTLDMNNPTPNWQPTGAMNSARYFHNLVMTATGKVFAVGGTTNVDEYSTSGVLQTEMWDPDTGIWSATALTGVARMYHATAMLLPDGRILSAGGGRLSPAPDQFNAQVYSPPYLFKGPRPTITTAPTTAGLGSGFVLDSPDASDIASVSLVSLATTTHSTDMSQIYRELTFTKTATQVTINAPLNTNELPSGYYMVFLVNSNGVPSEAKIIKFSPVADTVAPTVSITAPASGATVSGSSVTLSANASDNVGLAGVQFKLNGSSIGSEDTSSPYSITWDSKTVANGTYTLTAVARDASNNQTISAPVTITVDNPLDTTAPIITGVQSASITTTSATINWTTDEVASSQVEYGVTTGYGSTTTLNSTAVTSHSQNLSGLAVNTLYHYRILSRDPSGNLATSADFSFTTAASNPQTIAFDDLAGQNQPMPSSYPSGVIDWASGQWYLSAPWLQFTTKSISFNGGSQTSGTFSFVTPKKLSSIQALNGAGATTVTLSCSGNPNKVVSLPSGGPITTITTGWTNPCTTVTITNTNGWDTNFDNFIIE